MLVIKQALEINIERKNKLCDFALEQEPTSFICYFARKKASTQTFSVKY